MRVMLRLAHCNLVKISLRMCKDLHIALAPRIRAGHPLRRRLISKTAAGMNSMTRTMLLTAALGPWCVDAVPYVMAAEMTSPMLVQAGLSRFAHDDADVVRHAKAKAYERLAKEEDDFAKDADLLRAAIRDQPAAFRDAVDARIQQVLAAAHAVTLAGQTHVDADVHRTVDALADAVRELNAEFPEDLRSPV